MRWGPSNNPVIEVKSKSGNQHRVITLIFQTDQIIYSQDRESNPTQHLMMCGNIFLVCFFFFDNVTNSS